MCRPSRASCRSRPADRRCATQPVSPDLQEKVEQYGDDKNFKWHPDTNSAELAYILYQVPVLVGVHGSEMLPN